jgi:hypothetical protein
VSFGPEVEQAVAGTAVEPGNRARSWQPSEIGDAAKIDDDPVFVGAGESERVERRYQRRALARSRNVSVTKTRYDSNSGHFCQQRVIADLNGVAQGRSVTHGLAVTADGDHFLRGHAGAGEYCVNCCRIATGQLIAEQGGAMNFVVPRRVQGKQLGAQSRLERKMDAGEGARGLRGEFDYYRVDPVEAGARHEPYIELAGHEVSGPTAEALLKQRDSAGGQ